MRMHRGRPLILAYHRVARVERDPHLLCVDPNRFADHLDYLHRQVEIVPLRTLQERSSGRRVVITFDDGYADNATVAKTILEGIGVPATFFVTAGMVGVRREFWWDKLESILWTPSLGRDHLEVEVAGQRLWMDVRSDQARQRAYRAIHARLRRLPVRSIERFLDELISEVKSPTPDRETYRVLSEQELLSLSSHLFEVGAHSISHPLLSAQPLEEQRAEIIESRAMLEGLTGRPVSAFSYPFGGRDAFNRETVRLVKQAGYKVACTGLSGSVSRRSQPLCLPRNFVRDWNREEFAAWLSRRFAGE